MARNSGCRSSVIALRVLVSSLLVTGWMELGITAQPATMDGGTFMETGAMTQARYYHTATLIPGIGKVLVVGGYDNSKVLSSAEMYDQATGMWSPAGSLANARIGHTATYLSSGGGVILVAGGFDVAGNPTDSAEVYSVATNSWGITTKPMVEARGYHEAVALGDTNTVLVTGGVRAQANSAGSIIISSAELYSATTNSWSPAGNMGTPRVFHTATLLPGNAPQVLVAGGAVSGFGNLKYTASAELYDVNANSWAATSSMSVARGFHTANKLDVGTMQGGVLVAGGLGLNREALLSAEIYIPSSGSWVSTGTMAFARDSHNNRGTTLRNGQVLVTGGEKAELYDPAAGVWDTVDAMMTPRGYYTATLLDNGKVLLAGGFDSSGVTVSADLYTP